MDREAARHRELELCYSNPAAAAVVLGRAQVAPAGFRFTENCLSGPSAISSVEALVVCSPTCTNRFIFYSCDQLLPFPRPSHAADMFKDVVARCSPTQVNDQASSSILDALIRGESPRMTLLRYQAHSLCITQDAAELVPIKAFFTDLQELSLQAPGRPEK